MDLFFFKALKARNCTTYVTRLLYFAFRQFDEQQAIKELPNSDKHKDDTLRKFMSGVLWYKLAIPYLWEFSHKRSCIPMLCFNHSCHAGLSLLQEGSLTIAQLKCIPFISMCLILPWRWKLFDYSLQLWMTSLFLNRAWRLFDHSLWNSWMTSLFMIRAWSCTPELNEEQGLPSWSVYQEQWSCTQGHTWNSLLLLWNAWAWHAWIS